MSEPSARSVEVNGEPCRVWEKGEGAPLVFLAGLGGLPRWTAFLDLVAQRRRVIAPSLPGHPGALGHERLDSHLDWLVAVRELIEGAGGGEADLMGVSIGGALAADVAALWNASHPRLVLAAPLGMHDPTEPITDFWAQRPGDAAALLCSDPEHYLAHTAPPEGADPVEWEIERVRASTAEARLLWPMCDTGVAARLHRIEGPALVVWGEEDQVAAPSYARRFADAMRGPCETRTVPGAGHLVDLDAPEALAEIVLTFLR